MKDEAIEEVVKMQLGRTLSPPLRVQHVSLAHMQTGAVLEQSKQSAGRGTRQPDTVISDCSSTDTGIFDHRSQSPHAGCRQISTKYMTAVKAPRGHGLFAIPQSCQHPLVPSSGRQCQRAARPSQVEAAVRGLQHSAARQAKREYTLEPTCAMLRILALTQQFTRV